MVVRSTRPKGSKQLSEELPERLRLAVVRLARRLRQQEDTGATASQASALATITRLGPVTLGRLAAEERVQPPSMTRIVARLEAEGLVARHVDESDRRVARVTATPGGVRALERSRRRKSAYLARQIAALGSDDLDTLSRAVAVLEGILEDGR